MTSSASEAGRCTIWSRCIRGCSYTFVIGECGCRHSSNHPTGAWTNLQGLIALEAIAKKQADYYLLDRDTKATPPYDEAFTTEGTAVRTQLRSPNLKAHCERIQADTPIQS